MSYIIAIPSYKRAEICNNKTLKMLHENHIDKNKIYVYVANKEEYEEYKDVLDKSYYNKLVIGKKGLVQQREFISSQWPKGQKIVFIDDDMQSVDLSLSPLFKGKSLDHFFKEAFQACIENKSFIWGVYPVYNPFFRKTKKEMTTELKFIGGGFYGIINRPQLNAINLTITRTQGHKEDTERTLKYYIHDGIVLRFNKIGFVTKNFGRKGGMGNFEERLVPLKEATIQLQKKYPTFGRINIRKNGMYEFILYTKPRLTYEKQQDRIMEKTEKKRKTSKRRKTEKKRKTVSNEIAKWVNGVLPI